MMQVQQLEIPAKKPRVLLPENLIIDSWGKIDPFFENLQNRKIESVKDLEQWLIERSELEAFLEEDLAWRYIKMVIDTTDKKLEKAFHFFITEIEPKIIPFFNEFNKKLLASPFLNELNQEEYFVYLRGIKKEIEIFRERNIPLNTELQTETQKYGAISAKMMVEVNGEELTMQQAAKLLKDSNRNFREEVYQKISVRRLKDIDVLNNLYSHLIKLRNEVAQNAGFDNYRDYKFAEMGRFDYTPQDCFDFHHAIAKEVVPVVNSFDVERKAKLGLENLRPWDIDIEGETPLKPFNGGNELIDKSIKCFNKINSYFGERLAIMQKMKYIDLESKTGKAPGGFNYPLHEIGVPFIFMNAVGSQQDVVTMVHEGGHAIHSFLSRDLKLVGFKDVPSEVAELASMSMELLTMDYWDEFYSNEEDLKRAKREQLQRALKILPRTASMDKFQHWAYVNPKHSIEERNTTWNNLMQEFGSSVIDWTGNEADLTNSWQKALHPFEVPFYTIEYAMAQLGAIAIWRNYKQNPKKAINQYIDALKLGYTKSIGEIYKIAGIEFNFSQAYVKELVEFVKEELSKL